MIGELTKEEMDQLLRSSHIVRIACGTEDDLYIVPVTYAYDGEYIYAHSAMGKKIRMMRTNPTVCFEVDHFSVPHSWQSVIGWGKYEELTGTEAVRGIEFLLKKILTLYPVSDSETIRTVPGTDIRLIGDSHHEKAQDFKPVSFRIKILEKSGRYERHPSIIGLSPGPGDIKF